MIGADWWSLWIANAGLTVLVAVAVAAYVLRTIRQERQVSLTALQEELSRPQPALAFLEEERQEIRRLLTELNVRLEELEHQFARALRRRDGPPGNEGTVP